MLRLSGTLLICLVVGLAGCVGKPSATPEAVDVTSTPAQSPAPAQAGSPTAPISPVQGPSSPIPTPTPETLVGTPPPLVLPTPSSGTGVVYGRIFEPDGSPIGDAPVRLGVIVWFDGKAGEEGVVLAERGKAPQTVSDSWGRFVIVDVPPDTYGLGVHETNSDAVLFVPDDTGDKILHFDVITDSTIDLGEIEVRFPTSQ